MGTTTTVKLQRQQPGADHDRDVVAVQENVQRAIDKLQQLKVQTANIASGAVGSAQLANGLRQAFKYKLLSDTALTGDTDLGFGTKVSDDLALVTSGKIKPVSTGLVRLHVQLHLGARGLGASFNASYRAQLYVVDSGGSTVHASRWCFATTDASGSGFEIVADLDTEIRMTAGHSYTVRVRVLDGSNNPFSSLTARAESLSAQPYISGSHFELMPTPGS